MNSMISHIYIEYTNKTKTALTHISSNQLLFIINACHCDVTLTAHGEVIWVGGDERHFCKINIRAFMKEYYLASKHRIKYVHLPISSGLWLVIIW